MNNLIYGIEHEGELHNTFELRMPTIGDNIDAISDAGSDGDLAVNVALLARCLVSIGGIPKDKLTYDFLRSNLPDDDYDVLWAALGEVKKKRIKLSNTQESSLSAN